MTIARIIAQRGTADIIACDVATPVSQVVQTLASKRIGALPVLRDGSVDHRRLATRSLLEHRGGIHHSDSARAALLTQYQNTALDTGVGGNSTGRQSDYGFDQPLFQQVAAQLPIRSPAK